MSSYDLSNLKELIKFDEGCCKATGETSLITGYSDPSPVSPADIFREHFKCKTLWSLGYSSYLSERCMATFRRYALLRNGDIYDTLENKLLDRRDRVRVTFEPTVKS